MPPSPSPPLPPLLSADGDAPPVPMPAVNRVVVELARRATSTEDEDSVTPPTIQNPAQPNTTGTATSSRFDPFRPFDLKSLFGGRDGAREPDLPYLGEGVCLVDQKAVPFILYSQRSCPPHFYCPNANHTDPLSLPSMCPPTLECQKMRLSSRFCPPQGKYEPIPCQRGYYCPDYLTRLPCPEGNFCPTGSIQPRPCLQPFSLCPEGSTRHIYYGGILFCAIIDAVLLMVYFYLRWSRFSKERKRSREEVRKMHGRRLGTISETTHSRKQAKFVTLESELHEEDLDNMSAAPIRKSGVLSKRWWFKRMENLVNRLAIYFPIRFEVPQVKPKNPLQRNRSGTVSAAGNTTTSVLDVETQHGSITGLTSAERSLSRARRESVPTTSSSLPGLRSIGTFFFPPAPTSPPPPPPPPENLPDSPEPSSCNATTEAMTGTVSAPVDNRKSHMHYSLYFTELLNGFRRAFDNRDLSLHLEFEKLSLTLPSGKTILSGITGRVVPGRVTVIMGPSGAGKSTFMNVLMGKSDRTGGHLLINGRPAEMHKYKKLIGCVPQDDIMLHELTVRENIQYAARIRLPRSWSMSSIDRFVDAVIDTLDLSHVSDNLITSVSGGQRKRVNIGMELVTCPSAIFLDEPTSGLDATAALKVANVMKKIASDIGISVISVIHQPRYEIFDQFDDLLMIAPGGFTAYLGPRENVVSYFKGLGFFFDPRNNPADTLMDILSGKGLKMRNPKSTSVEMVRDGKAEMEEYEVMDLIHQWEERQSQTTPEFVKEFDDDDEEVAFATPTPSIRSRGTTLNRNRATSYVTCRSLDAAKSLDQVALDMPPCPEEAEEEIAAKQTEAMDNVIRQLKAAEPEPRHAVAVFDDPTTDETNSTKSFDSTHRRLRKACMDRGAYPLVQFYLAHNRSILQQYRKFNAFIMEILIATISGSLMGLAIHSYEGQLYQGLVVYPFTLISPSPFELVIPILALIISCAIGLAGAPAAVKIFSEEREIYYREAAAGHNKLAYYLAKNVSSTYRFIISSLHFTSVFMFFGSPNIYFNRMYAIQFLMFFGVYGLSYCVAMVVRRENAAMVAVCGTIISAALCGDGPSIRDMRSWGVGWILDMSYARWAAEAWYSEELLYFDGVFEIYNISAAIFGYTLDRFAVDLLVMVMIGMAWRVLGFALLVLVHRQKQR